MEFGTGALKVTPAHDVNDYNLGVTHKLATIDVFNEDGTLSNAAGHYIGMDRFAVRKQIAKDLEEQGLLEKTEQIRNSVGFSERTDAVVEPRISTQWWVNMKKFMADYPQVLSSVMDDEIQFWPRNSRICTATGWIISRTGVYHASYGGAIAYRHGMMSRAIL